MAFIELDNLQKSFGDVQAVNGVSLSVKKGEIVAVLGSNGAGKSTTIKMVCGLLKPTSGIVTIDGKNYKDDAPQIRKRLGYLPEESAMYLDVGLIDYLIFFARLYHIPQDEARKRIDLLLKQLDLHVGNRMIGELSKGMRRKVLIARSLLHEPDLLIYDEPASGLDPQTASAVIAFVKEQKEYGKTLLFSSHNLTHVEQIADRVVIIHKGTKVLDQPIDEITQTTVRYDVTVKTAKGTQQRHLEPDAFKALMRSNPDSLISVKSYHRSVEDVFLDKVTEKEG